MLAKFRTLSDHVRETIQSIPYLEKSVDGELSAEEQLVLTNQLPKIDEQMEALIGQASGIREESRELSMRELERNADSLTQSLQSARRKRGAVPRKRGPLRSFLSRYEFILREMAGFRASGLGRLPIIHRATNRMIGSCLLRPATGACEILIDYAKRRLGLSRVVAFVEPLNEASKRVLGRVGMSVDGHFHYMTLPVEVFALNLADPA